MARLVRLPACARGDSRHEHTRACLDVLLDRLPSAPPGWTWRVGATGTGWGVWLDSPNGGEFAVVDLPPASTLAGLASIVDAYLAGLDRAHEEATDL